MVIQTTEYSMTPYTGFLWSSHLGKSPTWATTDRDAQKKTMSRTKRTGATDIARAMSKKVVVTAKVLNVRTGPGTKYRKMAKVKYGQKFLAFEKRGNWRKIKLGNGQVGWVHIKYIREIKN